MPGPPEVSVTPVGARLLGWGALEVNLRGTGYHVKTENNNFGSKEPGSQLTKQPSPANDESKTKKCKKACKGRMLQSKTGPGAGRKWRGAALSPGREG